jgi:hypothetical protein
MHVKNVAQFSTLKRTWRSTIVQSIHDFGVISAVNLLVQKLSLRPTTVSLTQKFKSPARGSLHISADHIMEQFEMFRLYSYIVIRTPRAQKKLLKHECQIRKSVTSWGKE